MIQCQCPHCSYTYQVEDSYAGKAVKCPSCSERMTIPTESPTQAPGERKDDQFNFSVQGESFAQRRSREMQEEERGGSGGGGSGMHPAVGWLIFILIFGVGNIILYTTTGMVIIPIRR
jgi:predicted Zn finger-like uncharacterized protein